MEKIFIDEVTPEQATEYLSVVKKIIKVIREGQKMTIQDIIAKAFKEYPENFEIVHHGPFMDHTGEDMSDFEEDVYEVPRRAYIFGYADALGIDASHINQEIYKYKQGLRRKDN